MTVTGWPVRQFSGALDHHMPNMTGLEHDLLDFINVNDPEPKYATTPVGCIW
jgi:hypothetical protein